MGFAKPQDDLVNIGGNFWATPDEPRDPNYENPFSRDFIAIEREIVYDGCNLGIQLNGVLGFMRLPEFQLVLRNPDCKMPAPPLPPPQLPPQYEIPEIEACPLVYTEAFGSPQYIRNCRLYGNGFDELYDLSIVVRSEYNSDQSWTNGLFTQIFNPTTEILSVEYPVEQVISGYTILAAKITVLAKDYYYKYEGNRTVPWTLETIAQGIFTQTFYPTLPSETGNPTLIGSSRRRTMSLVQIDVLKDFNSQGGTPRKKITVNPGVEVFIGSNSKGLLNVFFENTHGDPPKKTVRYIQDSYTSSEAWEQRTLYSTYTFTNPEADPPPPPGDKEMACCPQHDRYLKLILKRLGDLPANVPNNIATKKPSTVKIESLAELMLWQVKQLDATVGNYPIEIKIKDTDAVKSGDQSATITIPNLSEGIAELIGLAVNTKRDTHATLITSIKGMTQAGMATKLSQMSLDVGLANAEFLGYELRQKKGEIAMTFTPSGKDLTETLTEKNVEYLRYENTDKQDLMDHLRKLLEMAARWTAQNWRRVSTSNPAGSIIANLRNGIGGLEIKRDIDKTEERVDFDTFTEQVERGFTDVTGISDPLSPWGDDYDSRPRVREIGKDNIKEQ